MAKEGKIAASNEGKIKLSKSGKGAKDEAQASPLRTILLILVLVIFCPLTGIPGMLAILFTPFFGLSNCQRFTCNCSKVFFKLVLWAAGCTYTVVGIENLDEKAAYFFASNHESHFDVPLIFSTLPFWLISMAKKSLSYIPIFGWAVAAGGTVWIDRKNTEKAKTVMNSAEKSLRDRPRSVLIFPEGTRTTDGNLQTFKKGGFILAIQTGMPVVPVCVQGTMGVVPKGGRSVKPAHLKVFYGKPIPTDKLTFEDRDKLCQDVYDAIAKLKADASKLEKTNDRIEPFWHCFLTTPSASAKTGAWGRVMKAS